MDLIRFCFFLLIKPFREFLFQEVDDDGGKNPADDADKVLNEITQGAELVWININEGGGGACGCGCADCEVQDMVQHGFEILLFTTKLLQNQAFLKFERLKCLVIVHYEMFCFGLPLLNGCL